MATVRRGCGGRHRSPLRLARRRHVARRPRPLRRPGGRAAQRVSGIEPHASSQVHRAAVMRADGRLPRMSHCRFVSGARSRAPERAALDAARAGTGAPRAMLRRLDPAAVPGCHVDVPVGSGSARGPRSVLGEMGPDTCRIASVGLGEEIEMGRCGDPSAAPQRRDPAEAPASRAALAPRRRGCRRASRRHPSSARSVRLGTDRRTDRASSAALEPTLAGSGRRSELTGSSVHQSVWIERSQAVDIMVLAP